MLTIELLLSNYKEISVNKSLAPRSCLLMRLPQHKGASPRDICDAGAHEDLLDTTCYDRHFAFERFGLGFRGEPRGQLSSGEMTNRRFARRYGCNRL